MTDSPKDRDAYIRAQAGRVMTDYEVRHYGHRRAFTVWWTCPRCRLMVAPYESHGHLR